MSEKVKWLKRKVKLELTVPVEDEDKVVVVASFCKVFILTLCLKGLFKGIELFFYRPFVTVLKKN